MNLISLSLWGHDERYIQGAIRNAELAPEIYPGWTVRVYCSSEVPVLDQLRSLGVDVRIVPAAPDHAGLFWRFLPAGEAELGYVIIRDADSRLSVREKAAVDAWIISGRPFHVMRDHVHHRNEPMLAGMWGCRGGSIPDIRDRIARFSRGAMKHDDTKFLREEIWPLARGRCLVHSSVREPLGGEAFPPHPPFEGFVGEIVDPRAEARDVVAILLPSRGRPEAALAAARSARAAASAPEQVRVAVGVEPEEAGAYREVFGADASWIRVLRSGGNYVRAIRELHRSTAAGIYNLCADDFLFETPGWDGQVRRAVADLPERIGLVHGDDGIQHDRIATAAFLTAEWIACVGDVLPGDYQHMFCDTEITEIARLAGLLRYLPDVRLTHRHHSVGETPFDETYQHSSATAAVGGAEFERRRRDRQGLADRLASAARAPTLSVLIQGLVQRALLLDDLVARLHCQRGALPDPSAVEILVEPDAGERLPAGKRRRLLDRARGRWVLFVEDDDVVADDATARILDALAQDPDCVAVGRVTVLRRSIALVAARKSVIDRDGLPPDAVAPLVERTARIEPAVVHRPVRSDGSEALRAGGVSPERRRRPAARSVFPSPGQRLLLKAGLARDTTALRAWEEWVRGIGPARADAASTRLYPLVWWNLQGLGADGIELNALKPHYWTGWAAAQAHLELAGETAAALERAGIPALLLRGVALAARHYERPELRPMRDVDLMVPDAFVTEGRRLLISAGWRPLEGDRDMRSGLGFRDRSGRRLHLRRRPLRASGGPSIDDGLWTRAETVEVGGTSTRIPAPVDLLLRVCVDGLRWAEPPAIHWVADAVAILRSSAGRLDWDVLATEAKSRHVGIPVRRALEHVRATFEVSALDAACRPLDALLCTVADRIDFQLRIRPPSPSRDLLRHWIDYARLHAGVPWLSRYRGFPEYLRAVWSRRSPAEGPGTAAGTDAHRLRQRART